MTSVLTSALAPAIARPPALTVASVSGSTTVASTRTCTLPSSLPAAAGNVPPITPSPMPRAAKAPRANLAILKSPMCRQRFPRRHSVQGLVLELVAARAKRRPAVAADRGQNWAHWPPVLRRRHEFLAPGQGFASQGGLEVRSPGRPGVLIEIKAKTSPALTACGLRSAEGGERPWSWHPARRHSARLARRSARCDRQPSAPRCVPLL